MFEQESYDKATVRAESQPGGLFSKYEIKNWEFSPLIYKILAASAVLHLAVLAFISQTNVLTMRGCDSPWVGRVCRVVDMAYVGAMLLGTEREYVDQEYEKTELGEADVTFIDVTNSAPLTYPEGYFQIANPVQFQMLQQQALNPTGDSMIPGYQPPGISPMTSFENDLLSKPAKLPPANPNPFIEDAPTPNPANSSMTATVRRPKGRGGKISQGVEPEVKSTPKDETVAGSNVSPQPLPNTKTDPITGDEINNRPFTELGKFVNSALDKKETDLQSEFKLSAVGKLTKEGKIDPKTFKYTNAESADKKLIEVLQEAIEAFNDSGRLKVLESLSGKDLKLDVQQDSTNIAAVIQSELESENRARAAQSSLKVLLDAAKFLKSRPDADQNDKDDLLLLQGASIESEGKNLVIKFNVQKDVVHQMLQRKLADARKANSEPSSTAANSGKSATASK